MKERKKEAFRAINISTVIIIMLFCKREGERSHQSDLYSAAAAEASMRIECGRAKSSNDQRVGPP